MNSLQQNQVKNNLYSTPQKRSDYFSDNDGQQDIKIQQNTSLLKYNQESQHNNYGQKDTIGKIPTTISFNQEGQFSIARSIIENESNFTPISKSQIPQLSQYKGDPQELVNHLTGKVFSLVEQVHKLSSIIEEMTTGQQELSEKYLELRSIYYQVLLDKGVAQPSEEEQEWLVLNGDKKQQTNTSPKQNNKITSQQVQQSSRDQYEEGNHVRFEQNLEEIRKQQQKLDEVIDNSEDKVKRSHKDIQSTYAQKGHCQNCELKTKQQQLMISEIECNYYYQQLSCHN